MSLDWDYVLVTQDPNAKDVVISIPAISGEGQFGSNNSDPNTDPGTVVYPNGDPVDGVGGTLEPVPIDPSLPFSECATFDCDNLTTYLASIEDDPAAKALIAGVAKPYELELSSAPDGVTTDETDSGYNPADGSFLDGGDLPSPYDAGNVLNFNGTESDIVVAKTFDARSAADIAAALAANAIPVSFEPASKNIVLSGSDTSLCRDGNELRIATTPVLTLSGDDAAWTKREWIEASPAHITSTNGFLPRLDSPIDTARSSSGTIEVNYTVSVYIHPYNSVNKEFYDTSSVAWSMPEVACSVPQVIYNSFAGGSASIAQWGFGTPRLMIDPIARTISVGYCTSTDPAEELQCNPVFAFPDGFDGSAEGWWEFEMDGELEWRALVVPGTIDASLEPPIPVQTTRTRRLSTIRKDGLVVYSGLNTFSDEPWADCDAIFGDKCFRYTGGSDTQFPGAVMDAASDGGSEGIKVAPKIPVGGSLGAPSATLGALAVYPGPINDIRAFAGAFSSSIQGYIPPSYCSRTP